MAAGPRAPPPAGTRPHEPPERCPPSRGVAGACRATVTPQVSNRAADRKRARTAASAPRTVLLAGTGRHPLAHPQPTRTGPGPAPRHLAQVGVPVAVVAIVVMLV